MPGLGIEHDRKQLKLYLYGSVAPLFASYDVFVLNYEKLSLITCAKSITLTMVRCLRQSSG